MTDKEKIEQAAIEYVRLGKASIADEKQIFKDGIHWRDKNPSPEVITLVETLRRIRTIMLAPSAKEMDIFTIIDLALSAREKK